MAGNCPFGFHTSLNQQAFSLGFPKLTVCNVYLMPSPSICHSPSVRPSSIPTLHSKNKIASRTFIKTKSVSPLLLLKTALLQRCDLGLVSALNEIKDYMTCKLKSWAAFAKLFPCTVFTSQYFPRFRWHTNSQIHKKNRLRSIWFLLSCFKECCSY